MVHLSLLYTHRRRLGSSQTLDRRGSRIVVEYVPGCGPMAGHRLLIRPSYRVLERHDWSRLSLMAHLSLVHMHRRRSGSSQALDRRRSRIVVACVPGCGPMAGHQLLINPSYRVLERHDRSRLSLMAHLSLVNIHRHDWVAPRHWICLLYTSPSPRDRTRSRMPSSA